jgi:hypothetical protein
VRRTDLPSVCFLRRLNKAEVAFGHRCGLFCHMNLSKFSRYRASHHTSFTGHDMLCAYEVKTDGGGI